MMSTTSSSLCTSISSGVVIPWSDLLNKRAVQRIVKSNRSVQAKGEKVKSVNKTGISADQCTWLLTSVIWFLFPSDKNDENSKTGKDQQYTKVIMDKIDRLHFFVTHSLTTKAVHTKDPVFSVNADKFLVKTKLNSRIPLFPLTFPASHPHKNRKSRSRWLLKFPHPAPVFSSHPEYHHEK